MLYTSYFGKLKALPKEIVPIAICGKVPDWYHGLHYKKLAPKWEFFSEWKKNRDNHFYVQCFNEQVLSHLAIGDVIYEIMDLADWADDIALLCYEKPENFCHRHLVANWMRENGVKIREY